MLRPSERIGSNFTPSARKLKMENLRYMKLRKKSRVKTGADDDLRRSSLPEIEPQTAPPTPKGAISVHSDTFTSSKSRGGKLLGAKSRWHKMANAGKTELTGAGSTDKDRKKPFLEEFPYKACRRRSKDADKDSLLKDQEEKSSRVQRSKKKFEPLSDVEIWKRTRAEIAAIRKKVDDEMKRKKMTSMTSEETLVRTEKKQRKAKKNEGKKAEEASLPCSPSKQMELIRLRRRQKLRRMQEQLKLRFGKDSEEKRDANLRRYSQYLGLELAKEAKKPAAAIIDKSQVTRIRSRLKSKWFQNIVMRKQFLQLIEEAAEDRRIAVNKAVLDYSLMDDEERKRVNVWQTPADFDAVDAKPVTIRAPVPWHQHFLIAGQFCRHNLFITNPILLRLQSIWTLRYSLLRFVNPSLLMITSSRSGDPLSPLDLQKRVFEQCAEARMILIRKWIPEVAIIFVQLRTAWRHLIPMKKARLVFTRRTPLRNQHGI